MCGKDLGFVWKDDDVCPLNLDYSIDLSLSCNAMDYTRVSGRGVDCDLRPYTSDLPKKG